MDFAEAAAIVLTSEGHAGKVYELAGDLYYTLKDLAAEISKQTGKELPYQNLPESEYDRILKSIGLPETFALAIAGWDVRASHDELFDNSGPLSALLGRSTTPLSQVVADALAA